MNNSFDSLIDKNEEIIYDMGLYPLCSAMCESLGIPEIINKATGPRDPRAVLDYGTVVKSMILNMLDERSQLLHFANSFENKDCEVLFGKGVTPELFTEDLLGDTLDAVSEINHRKLGSTLSLRSLKLHGVPIKSSHIDTTNLTLYGEYDNYNNDNKDKDFNIDYGKPKNKRTDLKQVNFGSAVQQDLLPLFGEGLSGNTSDAVYFREAMDEMAEFCTGNLYDNPILVYDAAASNVETFDKSYDEEIPCIIRLSKTFNAAKEYIPGAYQDDCWQDIGVIVNYNKKKVFKYKITPYEEKLGKHDWRLLVVYSSGLEKQKKDTASRNLPKKKKKLIKAAKKLAKKRHKTKAKAREAAESFIDKRSILEKLFDYQIEIESEITEKYERPGKPTPDTKKIKMTTYHAIVTIGEVNSQLYQEWLEYNSCFIIVSNVPKDRCTDQEILEEYKKQWKIEDQYKFIKKPKVIEPIWLHKPNRIKALLFILWLAVLVAAYLRHRLCQSLKLIDNPDENSTDNNSNSSRNEQDNEKEQTNKVNEKKQFTLPYQNQKELEDIYDKIIKGSVSGKILTTDGRLVDNPTFNVIENLFVNVQTKGYWEDGDYIRKFIRGTKRKLLKLIVYMGFHPSIYLEPYHPGHDLWKYG
jgi:transposase